MRHIKRIILPALVAVFLCLHPAHAQPVWQPLVFSKHAAAVAQEFGETNTSNVLIVVVTRAPGNAAYVVVIMKNGHRFKWTRRAYDITIKRISNVLAKIKKQKQASQNPSKFSFT